MLMLLVLEQLMLLLHLLLVLLHLLLVIVSLHKIPILPIPAIRA